jgi:hypothetical protein
MPLARDPDTLRVPAFMRKRNLRNRLARPLVLTALDRKKAGITVAKSVKIKASKQKAPKQKAFRRKRKISPPAEQNFSAPLLDFKTIGHITHYYDKIKVGVIKLSGTLSVGDCITYETSEGRYEQVVESLEIDRKPVFKAGRGKEIGLKLRKIPRVGSDVEAS